MGFKELYGLQTVPHARSSDYTHLEGQSKQAYIQRVKTIKSFYEEFLQGSSVVNVFLNKEIHFNTEGKNETKAKASKNLKTTIAVFFLRELLRNARFIKSDEPKLGQRKRLNADSTLIFYSDMILDGEVTTFKITVVKMKQGKKIHYCISDNVEVKN